MIWRNRLFKNKNAITPVLSNLLLMVVAVAAMSIATTSTYVITTNLRETMSERLIVEDLWFHPLTGEVQAYIRNIGKVAVQITAIYLNHTSQSANLPLRLENGEHNWLKIQCNWTSGSLYYLDIITTRGTHVAGYYKAPQTG